MFAQVVVDIAHSNVDKCFTYAVPEGLAAEAGHHVMVPFGRGNSPVEGFILSLFAMPPDGAQPGKIKEILRIIEPYPVMLHSQIALAQWMQEAYNCLLVDALRLMIPAQLRGGRVREKVIRTVCIPSELNVEAAVAAMCDKNGAPKAPKQMEVFQLLKDANTHMAVPDIASFVPGAAGAITALIKKGYLVESGHVTFRRPHEGECEPEKPGVQPTQEQQNAIDAILQGMDAGGGTYLLHGVTGSGKTEVYLRCIRHCIDSGKQAIVLVPEIALTPQTVGRFRSRFGDSVAVLHSRLSPGERFDEWRRIRLGKVQVAVGARSAVFAPFSDIGLIVIDEEHEQSYQSENIPRYHAAQVALHRCAQAHAPLVLGSATPSITSYHRAEQGRYRLIEMKQRVEARPMPKVTVVDMREEFMAGNNGIFSAALTLRLKECLKANKQAILFINRRGYSTFVSCRGCGLVLQCPNCDVSLTYHKTDDKAKCHYCGYTAKVPKLCPACGKPYIKYFGVGTQQVEEQLQTAFPEARAIRMDMDSTRSKDAHETLLSAFRRGEADVLIGTQMVAKGLDFPNVTLVGVVAADSTLYMPDYRSAERTFQLLTQVAGRAGRDETPGHVVIQTYSPDHPAIRFAKTHNYNGFYAHERNERQAALFPPFSLFVRVLFSGMEEAVLVQGCNRFAKGLNEALLQTLGSKNAAQLLYLCASPAPVKRRQGVYRYQVLVKLLRTADTARALKEIYRYTAAHRLDTFATLEVNPGDMF